ncbi:Putative aminoglycoside phosphotransferase (plasmid) [Variovorax sp. SRS16]|uniref:phosphotransferase family protein n=1 Tax=Variovorax sp. SRS16 TaxID=282217 RepID=UPI00131914BF|nr:phosphotransferase family protein [Variovorax sp. SRS16]VTU45517.1 Putative aminoglycoside phosphotransferase [Variovorax sp. SRS16]
MHDSSAAVSDSLAAYIRHATGAPASVRIHKKYVGGFSWLTWGFTLTTRTGERELILRLGHAEGLLSPYSAVPEYLVLSSLATSAVPLPQVLWHSDDPSWLGAPFLVVEKVEGVVNSPFGRKTDEAVAADRHIGEQFVDALVALHNFAWQETPARDLQQAATAQTAAAVQIAKWERMIAESRTRPLPLLHHAIGWLKRNQPVAPRLCIVHGDYRSGNFLQDHASITAVLDWELVHLGDPHEDIAWASMKFLAGGSDLVSGLIARDLFMARYEAGTGIPVSPLSLRFYEVLSLVKICAINLQAAARVESATAPDVRMTTLGFGLPRLQLEMHRIIGENA